MCACVLSRFSHVQLIATLQIVTCQTPLSMGILQARILEWVTMPSSSGSSQPRDWIEPRSPTLQAESLPSEPPGSPGRGHEVSKHPPMQRTVLPLPHNKECACSTLLQPLDYSPPGSSMHGILQARIIEWVAISFSRGSSQPRN